MKIKSSAVAMAGKQSYSHYQETHVTTTQMRASQWKALQAAKEEKAADVSISEESQEKLANVQEKEKESSKQSVEEYLNDTQSAKQVKESGLKIKKTDKNEQMLKTLQRMLEMLRKMRKGRLLSADGFVKQFSIYDLYSADNNFSDTAARLKQEYSNMQSLSVMDIRSSSASVVMGSASGVSSEGATAWIRHTEKSGYILEQENTTFSATGIAKTADGREIKFGVDLQMSRGFAGSFFSSKDEEVILTDPLVINLDSNMASVTDQKFFFDLDADGEAEEISSLGSGSGFLAYDKNGDGVINDGSELFGTKSGDGFADLAQYDEDGNGWIDENDSIFNNLKVWVKNEDGSDRLLDLKEANVGAIYLGSADTQFHLNNAYTNQTNAVIQKTGVFLKETGEVGTIQHVDLAL
ncbi:MAG: hypothetical protein HFJ06_05475 [Lachnospiraceae bacterium]|nr:hypothetical protein [Lachnospiraceae bacterium]